MAFTSSSLRRRRASGGSARFFHARKLPGGGISSLPELLALVHTVVFGCSDGARRASMPSITNLLFLCGVGCAAAASVACATLRTRKSRHPRLIPSSARTGNIVANPLPAAAAAPRACCMSDEEHCARRSDRNSHCLKKVSPLRKAAAQGQWPDKSRANNCVARDGRGTFPTRSSRVGRQLAT
jgi:hypothetical protein